MGSNPAECHPISFKWVTEAMNRGAKLISVDPRFTRTSAKADIYAAMRSGTDIALLGGMINYIIENKKYFKEYVAVYTNGAFIVADSFDFSDGLFSGFDPGKRKYDKSQWAFLKDEKGISKEDRSLQDPRCVFQLLKKHYSRYDMDTVSAVTGTSKKDLVKIYETYAATGERGRAGTIMYAMGWTQHTVGTQNIRTMAII
jgi:formate dehydrogenase major subunit